MAEVQKLFLFVLLPYNKNHSILQLKCLTMHFMYVVRKEKNVLPLSKDVMSTNKQSRYANQRI